MQPGQNFKIAQRSAHPLTIRPPSFKFLSQPVFEKQSFEKRSSKANIAFSELYYFCHTADLQGQNKYFWVTIK
jgi:hypothetical protein